MSKRQGDRLIHTVVVAGLIRRTDELDEVSVTGAVNEALRFVCHKTVLIVDNHVCYCAIFEHGIHNPEGTGTSHYYFKEGTYYTIPYRSLMPKNIKNLLAARPLHFRQSRGTGIIPYYAHVLQHG